MWHSITGSCEQRGKSPRQMEELPIAHSQVGMMKFFQKSSNFGGMQMSAVAAFCPGVKGCVCPHLTQTNCL